MTAIMGPSGSGKSTLLHCLAGLDRLTSGQIFLGDVELSALSEKQLTLIRRDKIGFVFQAYNLVPTLNALENITLPMSLARKQARPGVARHRRHHGPAQGPAEPPPVRALRVVSSSASPSARALLSRPEIVFADEPTGNLDSRSGAEILTFMREAVDDFGQTMVIVTHDPIAAGYADRVVFLADGKIVDEMLEPTAATRARPHEEPRRVAQNSHHVAGHDQRADGEEAPPRPHVHRGRARRRVHVGHVRAHRHARQRLRQALHRRHEGRRRRRARQARARQRPRRLRAAQPGARRAWYRSSRARRG